MVRKDRPKPASGLAEVSMTPPGMQAGVSDVQGLVGPQLTEGGDSDSIRADHFCKGGVVVLGVWLGQRLLAGSIDKITVLREEGCL